MKRESVFHPLLLPSAARDPVFYCSLRSLRIALEPAVLVVAE
jgi:hypothetical protein